MKALHNLEHGLALLGILAVIAVTEMVVRLSGWMPERWRL